MKIKCKINTIYDTHLDNDEKNNMSNNKHLVCLSSMLEYPIVLYIIIIVIIILLLVSPSDDPVTLDFFYEYKIITCFSLPLGGVCALFIW